MASREDLDTAYMACAFAIANLSHARRKKVGAIIVASGGIIAEGTNGTPSGFDNNCETEEIIYRGLPHESIQLVTKQECIHAESNAILKVARSNNSSIGATLYCTLTPCFECAKLIIQAGIVRVVYAEQYPYATHTGPMRALGIELLEKAKIPVDKLDGFIEH